MISEGYRWALALALWLTPSVSVGIVDRLVPQPKPPGVYSAVTGLPKGDRQALAFKDPDRPRSVPTQSYRFNPSVPADVKAKAQTARFIAKSKKKKKRKHRMASR